MFVEYFNNIVEKIKESNEGDFKINVIIPAIYEIVGWPSVMAQKMLLWRLRNKSEGL
jgi:hypothetical protein